MALMARAYNQAQKFGAEMAIPDEAIGLAVAAIRTTGRFVLKLSNDERVSARSVVIASGARYRRLEVDEPGSVRGLERALLGIAAGGEAVRRAGGRAGGRRQFGGPGGGLSGEPGRQGLAAGARARSSESSMSRYLVDRIAGLSNVEVVTQAQVTGLEGDDGMLEAVRWRHGASGEEVRRPIRHLFLFIGAEPNTDWLSGSGVALDPKGFVLTGAERRGPAAAGDQPPGRLRHRRRPLGLDQAGRRGGRRGRAGGGDAARVFGRDRARAARTRKRLACRFASRRARRSCLRRIALRFAARSPGYENFIPGDRCRDASWATARP